MSLLETLNGDLKTAMKARDKETLSVVRMLKAAVTNEQINLGHELSPEEELVVLSRELKQRKESLYEFEKAGRDDLTGKAKEEITIVSRYLPAQLTDSEIKELVKETIAQVHATSSADFGKVMGALMPKVKGKADGNKVNQIVKASLT